MLRYFLNLKGNKIKKLKYFQKKFELYNYTFQVCNNVLEECLLSQHIKIETNIIPL